MFKLGYFYGQVKLHARSLKRLSIMIAERNNIAILDRRMTCSRDAHRYVPERDVQRRPNLEMTSVRRSASCLNPLDRELLLETTL
jgi:hypothetical protein